MHDGYALIAKVLKENNKTLDNKKFTLFGGNTGNTMFIRDELEINQALSRESQMLKFSD